MGAAASITARSGDEETLPKLKVTRKVNSIRVKNLPSPKKKRRPSFFDDRQNSESDDMDLDTFIADAREGDVMSKATRSILVQAVEEFLTMNGTDVRSNVIDVVVNSMNPLMLQKGQSVITQGEVGSFVYVLESGNVSVVVNGEQIRTMSSGTLFGELALLFDARRSATITCLEKCKLWSLNRSAFKVIQRNATNLAIMQRTRRFQVVPELSVLPSATLAKLVTSLTPMTYKYGDHLYSAGKCSTKIMLIEEGTVEIQVPPSLQHMPQQEIERIIGIIRPASYEYKSKNRPSLSNCGSCTLDHNNDAIASMEMTTTSFTITEGCVIGMGILLGKIGSLSSWIWVDAKVDGKPYVGAMPPVTALAEGVVKTAFFTVYRFERILGPTEQFYESYTGIAAGTEKAKLWPFNASMHNDCETTHPPFVPETDFNLDYFDTVVPIHSIHMGYFALGYRGSPLDPAVVNKYVLKRLFKSVIAYQNNVKHVLDEAKILESLNCPFVLRMLGKFQTPDELIFVFETVPSGDLWTLIHEHDELRDPAGFLRVDTTRFYVANIILALEHMHDKKVAYRNLKPENILMNSNGYIKVAGMAFAKIVPFMTPQGALRVTSFTFCGTLEYLAPEMVLNSGHDQGVDKWALGVLMYEMLTGMTPFEVDTSSQVMEHTSSISEKSSNSRCKLRRSKSDNRMKERNEYLPEDRKRSDSSSRHGSTNSVSSCSDVVSSRRRVGSTASAAMDALRGSEGGAQESSTARSMYSPSGSKRELDTVLVRADSLNSIGSDNSDSGFRLETRTHDANKSLRGDNAAKLLSTIAGLKSSGVDLPDDFSDLDSSAEITSLIMQLLNPDPLERPEIRRDFVNNVFQQGFFFNFDWASLTDQTMPAPYIPNDNHSAFMNSRFSKKSYGAKFDGDDNVFAGF